MNPRSAQRAAGHNWKAAVRRSVPKPLLWKIAPMRLSWYILDGGRGNFGDELSPLIISNLFGVDVKESSISTADMISLGSLFETVEELVEDLAPYVWGTGFIRNGPSYAGRPLRVRAVRGRLSLERVRRIAPGPVALGDPGLLARQAFPELSGLPKRYPISIIPHYNDSAIPEVVSASAYPGVHIIDVLQPPTTVLEEISGSELVLSSSLHGLIVSESFGVPNFWTPLSDHVAGSGYKFRDYYSTFNTEPRPLGLADALTRASDLGRGWTPLPGVGDSQQALVESFPVLPRHHLADPDRLA